ncbi:MAG: type II secretion system protein [Gammaproteobacteria bacterium]|nr:type II secretion system protein [Gammaproteobacteria bacterium]
MKKLNRRHSGFTLLEVIVALTITGFVLGSLFSLVGGSKQLSWRSEQSLVQATRLRAAINFSLLEDEFSEVEKILQDDSYQIRALDLLEDPVRKTEASIYGFQAYEIINRERDEVIEGSRWIQFDLPQ